MLFVEEIIFARNFENLKFLCTESKVTTIIFN